MYFQSKVFKKEKLRIDFTTIKFQSQISRMGLENYLKKIGFNIDL